MLALKPNCECCDRDLWPETPGAYICSFECTYCTSCATDRLGLVCPACSGPLVPRPVRSAAMLARYPASSQRAPLKPACQPEALA